MTVAEKSKEEAFVERIESLDTGQLAMLRRGCGEKDPITGRCPWFYGLIHGVATESPAFLLASLLAQYKTAVIKSGGHRLESNFGKTWKKVTAGSDSESLKRRFHILLETEYNPWNGEGDFPFRMRQLVRYAANKGIGVNWPLLLKHIRNWNSPTKWVQKEWAHDFFGNTKNGQQDTDNHREN